VLLPLAVSAIALIVDVGGDYLPTGDYAYIEMHTRDVGHHPVLIGLYSRVDWSHPGPAAFYLLALPYRLMGSASVGVNVGALLINGAAIAGMALVARRRGGTPLMLITLVGCGVLVRALGADFLRDPWNPSITVLPFGLLLFLCWEMTAGEAWALPAAVGVASYCVQTHIGYAPMAIPLVAWGAAWLVVRGRGEGRRRRRILANASLVAAAVVAVMWLPPLIDQVVHSPGNFTRIARYFDKPDAKAHTLAQGYRVVGAQFGVAPDWIAGQHKLSPLLFGETDLVFSAPVPVLLLPFGLAVLVLWRRRSAEGLRLAATLALALVLGVIAVARTIGAVNDYRLRWTWVLGMVAAIVVAWSAWTLVAGRWPRAESRALVPLAVSLLVVFAGLNAIAAARAGTPAAGPDKLWSTTMAALIPPAAHALPAGQGDVLVHYTSIESLLHAPGVVLGLERRGIDAKVEPEPATRFGEHRVHRGGAVRAVLTLVSGADVLSNRPGARLVAYWGVRPKADFARAIESSSALDAAHVAGRLSEQEWLRRRQRLSPGDAVAVFMSAPASAR
jgi:hypothetical protein